MRLDPSNRHLPQQPREHAVLAGPHDEAEAAHREALRLDPDNAVITTTLGPRCSAWAWTTTQKPSTATHSPRPRQRRVSQQPRERVCSTWAGTTRRKPSTATQSAWTPATPCITTNLGNALFFLGLDTTTHKPSTATQSPGPRQRRVSQQPREHTAQPGPVRRGGSRLPRRVRLDPGNAAYHNNLGNALCFLGPARRRTSRPTADAVAWTPTTPRITTTSGTHCAAWARQTRQAAYRDAVRLDPGNAAYHNNLGIALSFLGRYDEVEAADREAVRLDRGNAAYHNNLGIALASLGRTRPGGSRLSRGSPSGPRQRRHPRQPPDALRGLGLNYDAQAAYRDAVRLDPDNAAYHNNLGIALFFLGLDYEAEAAEREPFAWTPATPRITTTSGTRWSSWAGTTRRKPPIARQSAWHPATPTSTTASGTCPAQPGPARRGGSRLSRRSPPWTPATPRITTTSGTRRN